MPKSLNESNISIGLKTKYIGAGVGEMLNGPTSHINIDMLYSDVSTYRFCIEHYHVKPGTQKFHECLVLLAVTLYPLHIFGGWI